MNNHVVTKETAILLKEAGFPQESSIFYWSEHINRTWELRYGRYFSNVIAAPIANEILDRLPGEIRTDQKIYYLYVFKGFDDRYRVVYCVYEKQPELNRESDNSLAEAAAKMYIYLSKHNLLSKE